MTVNNIQEDDLEYPPQYQATKTVKTRTTTVRHRKAEETPEDEDEIFIQETDDITPTSHKRGKNMKREVEKLGSQFSKAGKKLSNNPLLRLGLVMLTALVAVFLVSSIFNVMSPKYKKPASMADEIKNAVKHHADDPMRVVKEGAKAAVTHMNDHANEKMDDIRKKVNKKGDQARAYTDAVKDAVTGSGAETVQKAHEIQDKMAAKAFHIYHDILHHARKTEEKKFVPDESYISKLVHKITGKRTEKEEPESMDDDEISLVTRIYNSLVDKPDSKKVEPEQVESLAKGIYHKVFGNKMPVKEEEVKSITHRILNSLNLAKNVMDSGADTAEEAKANLKKHGRKIVDQAQDAKDSLLSSETAKEVVEEMVGKGDRKDFVGNLVDRVKHAVMGQTASERVDELIKANDIVVFGKSYCGMSQCAKDIVDKYSKYYEQDKKVFYDVDRQSEENKLKQAVYEKADQHSLPAVWIKQKFVGDCETLKSMEKSGKLVKLFKTL